jgi:hypothetical protein
MKAEVEMRLTPVIGLIAITKIRSDPAGTKKVDVYSDESEVGFEWTDPACR